MPTFMAFELKRGLIQELGLLYFGEVPSKGEFIEFPGTGGAEARSYVVFDIELATDANTASGIILTPKE